MAKSKPKYKVGETFFHPEQRLFVVIDEANYYEGDGKGWLYNLKVFTHGIADAKPWKRYYEHRIMSELTQMKRSTTTKVLYGSKGI